MAIKYEYNSTCCNHFYVETRNADDAQVVTKCNVCGQGEYVETNQIEIETISQPIYQASEEQIVSVRDRLILAGFTEEEIDLLIQESQAE
jgi:hypothetical protein